MVDAPPSDVLLRFRRHKIALGAEVRKICHVVLLLDYQKDWHQLVWRDSSKEPLVNYRMTRSTFGVSALSFKVSTVVQQNEMDNVEEYPHTVLESFHVQGSSQKIFPEC